MDADRAIRIRQIVATLRARLAAGDNVRDEVIIEANRELMPELAEEMRRLRVVRAARERAENGALDRASSSFREASEFGTHIRCPHCRNPMEIVVEDPLTEILCASCGSSFSLWDIESTDSRPGETKQLGRFELLDRVGCGQFGAVWKAFDSQLERIVAVKIPRKGHFDDVDDNLGIREARAVAQLAHPNIVRVHEVGQEGGRVYIVSDYVEGSNLAEWLSAQQFTPREAAALCLTISDALHHAHRAGVIHRDLKPSNIMLDADGQPHLTDFGLAKRESDEITLTIDGRILGTPAYMPPEQARGEGHRADCRADVYSLGVILFELLTGERPFRGDAQMLISQILSEDPPNPRTLNHRVPRDLQTICLKCLEKDPRHRYATAEELAADLRRFLGGNPIHSRPLGRIGRTWRWCRRHPATVAVGAAAVSMLLLGAAVIAALRESRLRAVAQSEAHRARQAAMQTERERVRADAERQRARKAEERSARYSALHRYAAEMNLLNLIHGEQPGQCLIEMHEKYGSPQKEKDFRGFEWYFLNSLFHQQEKTFRGHTARVSGIAFADEGRLLSSDVKGDLCLWDVHAGQRQATFEEAACELLCMVLAPNRAQVAAGDAEGRVTLWSIASGKVVNRWKAHEARVASVDFHPNCDMLATGGHDHAVRVWNSTSGALLHEFSRHRDRVTCVAFSAQGELLAAGSIDSEVHVWEVPSWEHKWTSDHPSPVFAMAFSPDGRFLSTGDFDRTLRLFNGATGELLDQAFRHTGSFQSMAFFPDGLSMLTAGNDDKIWEWSLNPLRKQCAYMGHVGTVGDVHIAPDGNSFATGGSDQTARLWRRRRPARMTHEGPALSIDIDHRLVVSGGSDRKVRVWERGTGALQAVLEGHTNTVYAVRLVRQETELISGGLAQGDAGEPGGEIIRWRWNSNGWELAWRTSLPTCAFDVAVDPTESLVAAVCGDGAGFLLDLNRGELVRRWEAHTGEARSIAFSPDGRLMATGGADGAVRTWSIADGLAQSLVEGHKGNVWRVAFLPNGKLLASGGVDGYVHVWNVAEHRKEASLPRLSGSVYGLSISPDGRRLVTGDSNGFIRTWALGDCEAEFQESDELPLAPVEVLTLTGHSHYVWDVAFSNDGRTLASASHDGSVRLWNSTGGRE